MKTTDNNNKVGVEHTPPVLKITTHFDLWEFLFQSGPQKKSFNKYTKPEAFFDLMKRQRWAILTQDNDFLEGSVLSLSKAWGWDRTTVMNFIKKLSDLQVITTSKANGKHIFRLNHISLE